MAVKNTSHEGEKQVVTQRDKYTESKEMRGKRNEKKIKLDSSSLTLTKCLQRNIHTYFVFRTQCDDPVMVFPIQMREARVVRGCVSARISHSTSIMHTEKAFRRFFFCVRIFCGANSRHISAQNSEQTRTRSMSFHFHFAWWESSFFVHLFSLSILYATSTWRLTSTNRSGDFHFIGCKQEKKFSIPTLEKPPTCRARALWGEINTEQHYSCSRGAVLNLKWFLKRKEKLFCERVWIASYWAIMKFVCTFVRRWWNVTKLKLMMPWRCWNFLLLNISTTKRQTTQQHQTQGFHSAQLKA